MTGPGRDASASGVAEGFAGQRLRSLSAARRLVAPRAPVTARLLVTDIGVFPRAAGHGFTRPRGIPETIVIVCTRGAGWVEAAGHRHDVAAGEAVVIPAHTPHAYGASDSDPWSIWWLHAVGGDLAEFHRALQVSDAPVRLRVRDTLAVVALFEDALAAFGRDETPATLMRASGVVWHLFAHLVSGNLVDPPGRGDRILAAQEHLRAHLSTPVRLQDLARAANLSPSQFSYLFRQATGTTVIAFVRELRIARARELLLTTDHGVSTIAAAVGYADPYYFTKEFRRLTGSSPTQFREQADRRCRA